MNDKKVAVEPVAVPLAEAAALIGVSRSKLYQLVSAGRFGPAIIKFGKRSVVGLDELRRWIEAGAPGRAEWNRIKKERQC